METYAHMFNQFLFFQARGNKGRLSYVYPFVSLINQVFVIYSVTMLQRHGKLCFKRIVLYSGDSRKSTIMSLNRLVHWKVKFQSL